MITLSSSNSTPSFPEHFFLQILSIPLKSSGKPAVFCHHSVAGNVRRSRTAIQGIPHYSDPSAVSRQSRNLAVTGHLSSWNLFYRAVNKIVCIHNIKLPFSLPAFLLLFRNLIITQYSYFVIPINVNYLYIKYRQANFSIICVSKIVFSVSNVRIKRSPG